MHVNHISPRSFWIADPRDPANAYDPAEDLLDTVRIIAEKYVKDKSAREEYLWCDKVNSRTPVYRIRRAKGRRDPVLMDEAVRTFNAAFRKLKDEGKVARTRGDKDLLRHVLFQAYSRVVSPEVDMLKGKRMFTNLYVHALIHLIITTGLFYSTHSQLFIYH